MPYGCAINEYSSGVCQLPPASYQPYPRSTAVSLEEHNVPIGISEGCFCLMHLCGLANLQIMDLLSLSTL